MQLKFEIKKSTLYQKNTSELNTIFKCKLSNIAGESQHSKQMNKPLTMTKAKHLANAIILGGVMTIIPD